MFFCSGWSIALRGSAAGKSRRGSSNKASALCKTLSPRKEEELNAAPSLFFAASPVSVSPRRVQAGHTHAAPWKEGSALGRRVPQKKHHLLKEKTEHKKSSVV